MSGPRESLDLLLRWDDDANPPLGDGLPADAAMKVEVSRARGAVDYVMPGGDWNSLEDQGWAVIAPEGPAGDRLLALAAPLIAKRAADQGIEAKDVKVLRVPGDPALDAAQWSKTIYDDKTHAAQDVPLYQLILGNFDQVPLSIQQFQAATGGCVGRLHFDDERGYGAYIDKLLASEKAGPRPEPGQLVVHTAHDGSPALTLGYDALIQPCLALMKSEGDIGRWPGGAVASGGAPGVPDQAGFLERAAAAAQGVLFTMSHGAGGPRNGWKSEADRRARQGAMSFGLDGFLTGADLANAPVAPGGVWFMFACYGAGTPAISAYQPWLQKLVSLGVYRSMADLLTNLKGASPFVAALPQAVLANPKGPLAFIGHVDLAWTYSFMAEDSPAKRRPGQFERVLDTVLRSHRVGIALGQIYQTLISTDHEIASIIDLEAHQGATTTQPEDIRRAYLWMMRQDLSGYVLLGDPAARLPVTPARKKPAG
jgi:hypothetical protein